LVDISLSKTWTTLDSTLIIQFQFGDDRLKALRTKQRLFSLTEIYLDEDLKAFPMQAEELKKAQAQVVAAWKDNKLVVIRNL
jgi:hypothetical protein